MKNWCEKFAWVTDEGGGGDIRKITVIEFSLTSLNEHFEPNWLFSKAGHTATPVACGWAGAVFEVTRSFGLEQ